MASSFIGKHVILECAGSQAHLNINEMKDLMSQAALKAGATIITSKFHHFGEGHGITGVLVLAESHITVHTWPESNYAAFDFFMCGHCDPEIAAQIVIDHDKTSHCDLKTLNRQRPGAVKPVVVS